MRALVAACRQLSIWKHTVTVDAKEGRLSSTAGERLLIVSATGG
jgi:hypothetical protein